MSSIPKRLQELLKAVGEDGKSACWEVRSGTWAVKHKALEKVAMHLNIEFDAPQPLNISPEFAAICVTGRLDGKSEWSVGEASAATSHNKYYCAMAEKRAKDRVILKLIGLHGDTYSEEEADDFREKASNVKQAEADLEACRARGMELLQHLNAVRKHWNHVIDMKHLIKRGDVMEANRYYCDIENDDLEALFGLAPSKGGVFTTEERAFFRTNESNSARKEIYGNEQ